MKMTINQTVEGKTEKVTADIKLDMTYTDFNGDFEVKVPDEVIRNAKKAEL